MRVCSDRVCVQRNPSALRGPIPVCFMQAKSSVLLGFFSLSLGSTVGVAQPFGAHCVLLQR